MATEVKKCNCNNDTQAGKFQNETYGQGMRVCNETMKKDYTCTLCGAKHK